MSTMTFLQWRRFVFFDKEVVIDVSSGEAFSKLKDVPVTCSTAGRGQILFGDSEGNFHILNRQLELRTISKAFERDVTHLHQLRVNDVLVSVGTEESDTNNILKVWNLDKEDQHGYPFCCRITRVMQGTKLVPGVPSPRINVIAVHDNMSLMAVGWSDGSVVLFKGDITRERHSKQKIIHDGSNPVSGLAFRQSGKSTHLFIATTNSVCIYNLSTKEKEQKVHLDSVGCPVRCCIMTDSRLESQLVMGCRDAMYFYHMDGRGPCLAFEGQKLQLSWHRNYLVVVSHEKKQTTPQQATPAREMNLLTVYDIQNKFIAYSAPIPEVKEIVTEWGSLYIYSADGKLYQLHEKDIQTKLDLLFKKSLYGMAIQLVKSQQFNEDCLSDIFRQYGDHLYQKGDHDNAIAQYIQTIGKLEPSYVIRKFLDAQRIHNLTTYLQELHKQSLATEDHTTLLLNCYTKLKDNNKLDEFIMGRDRDIDFAIEIAIKVCRQAGYFKHALYLAEKHEQHELYLKIQLDDLKDCNRALDYMGRLEFDMAEKNMKMYGKILMEQVPEQATEFLKRLCTEYKTCQGFPSMKSRHAEAEDFINIFVNNPANLTEFLEHMIKVRPRCKSAVYNTLLELYLRDYTQESNSSSKQKCSQRVLDLLQSADTGYDIDQALLMCCINKFQPGILYLYQKSKLYQQVLKYHMDQRDYANVISTCKKFGSAEPNLWVEALSYFSSIGQDDTRTYLTEVLLHVEKEKLLPPLTVVEMMAHSPTVTLAVVKDYLLRQLSQENELISEDTRLIQYYQEDTNKIKKDIENIKINAQIFQVSKCCACSHPLELPSVHFLCEHSFHQHCFESYSEDENECPVCLPENKKVLDVIHAQDNTRDMHEQFHTQLEKSDDAFAVVAEFFGRGLFSKLTVVNADPIKERQQISGGATASGYQATSIPKPAPARQTPPTEPYLQNRPLVSDSGRPIAHPISFSSPRPVQVQPALFKSSPASSYSNPARATPKAKTQYDSSLNPFEDDDAGVPVANVSQQNRPVVSGSFPARSNKSYPDDLNPFEKKGGQDDYDKGLNPFET